MMSKAISIKELKCLIDKHKIGRTGYVELEPFLCDVEKIVVEFYGPKRINNLSLIVADAEQRINNSNRYCKSISGLAELFGVDCKTFSSWSGGTLSKMFSAKHIEIERKTVPLRKYEGKVMYDAKDVLKQLKRLLKKQSQGRDTKLRDNKRLVIDS